jgi:dolichol-phosphate mannosyltransferase
MIRFIKKILNVIPFFKRIELMFDYASVSLLATIVDVLLLYSLTEFLNINYLISATISYCTGLLISFYLQKTYTFKENKNTDKIHLQFTKFTVISLIGLILNLIILKIFVEIGIWYLFAKAIAIVIVFFWNFLINKKITFRR